MSTAQPSTMTATLVDRRIRPWWRDRRHEGQANSTVREGDLLPRSPGRRSTDR